MPCGVYIITNTVNGKLYVGSSCDIERRWREHIVALRAGRHGNPHLQKAWKKYGEESFNFSVFVSTAPSHRLIAEQQAMDCLKPFGHDGYNISPTSSNCSGVKHSPAAKHKMSKAKLGKASTFKGRHHTAEAKAKIRAHKIGKKQPIHLVLARAESNRGKKRSEETKERLRKAQTGKKFDDAAKKKMRASKLGSHWILVDGKRIWSKPCQH